MSTLYVDKIDPSTGTALEIGSSGDTVTVPSGATLTVSGTMNASSITAGTMATARLGSGTASSTTVLYGDQTYKTEPSSVVGTVMVTARSSSSQSVTDETNTLVDLGTEIIDTDSVFASSTYTVPTTGTYFFNGSIRFRDTDNVMNTVIIMLYLNGSAVADEFAKRESVSYDANWRNYTLGITSILSVSATDTIKLYGYIDSDNGSNVKFDVSQFQAFRLS